MPTASLPALERRLEARLLELDRLQRARRQLDSPLARAEAGRQIDELLLEIGELERAIDTGPAVSLADAAVKLRRLSAHLGPGSAARLLAGALAAVERATVEVVRDRAQR
jgi:hypothetical protein